MAEGRGFRLTGDAVSGVVGLAGSAVLFVLAGDLPRSALVPIGPGFYPQLALGLTAVLSAVLAVKGLVAGRAAPATKGKSPVRPNYPLVVLVFAIFFAYAFGLPRLGFRVSTFLFLLAAEAAIELPRTPRRLAAEAAVALGATIVTYLLFETYLDVLLPRGSWTGF